MIETLKDSAHEVWYAFFQDTCDSSKERTILGWGKTESEALKMGMNSLIGSYMATTHCLRQLQLCLVGNQDLSDNFSIEAAQVPSSIFGEYMGEGEPKWFSALYKEFGQENFVRSYRDWSCC